MPRLSQVEVYEIRVQALTPIHVGMNERLTGVDYIHHGGWLYVVDHDKLFQELEKNRLVNMYLRELESGHFSLTLFLRNNGVDVQRFAEKVARYRIRFRDHLRDDSFSSELMPFIRTLEGSVYLPGSSLKGSLRTSLIYGILKSNSGLAGKLLEEIKQERKGKGAVVESVLRRDTHSFESDLLRLLRPSDLFPEAEVETCVARLLSMRFGGSGQRRLGFVEVVPSGTVFRGGLHVFMVQKVSEKVARKDMVGTLVSDLVKMANERSRAVLQRDLVRLGGGNVSGSVRRRLDSLLDEVSKVGELEAVTSLGYGQGYWKTTVTMAFENLEGQVFRALGSRRFSQAAPRSFPSSMRLVQEGADGEPSPLGWVKLSFRR
ncbi:MAG: type III-A CRISPR-associated RAMP protein Csm5 [Candidatus Caldarchaeum sp.]